MWKIVYVVSSLDSPIIFDDDLKVPPVSFIAVDLKFIKLRIR